MIAAFAWPEVARVVRSQALSVVRLPYMDAARVIGGRHRCWWNTLLAQSLGINESTVRRRFEALMSRGCIQLVTLVSAALLRYETEVILWLDVAPARLDALAHELAGHRGVRFIAATLGQTSLMCEVIMPTTSDLFTFTTSTLAGLEGIRSWQASIEMTTLKRGFVHLPWAYERLS